MMNRCSLTVCAALLLVGCVAREGKAPEHPQRAEAAPSSLFARGQAFAKAGDSRRAEEYMMLAVREGYPEQQAVLPIVRVCDRIVVGEIRGREALELISAMTSGHDGCLSTIHATSPGDALARLETLALSAGLQLPLWALRSQIASAIDVVVQSNRMADGSRQITEISEVRLGEQAYVLEQRYRSARASRASSLIPSFSQA